MVKLNIVAPMDMKKDTLLELEVDGKICAAKCPRDVTMGEPVELDVVTEETVRTPVSAPIPTPAPREALDKKASTTVSVHEGSFKYGLCGCTDVCCQPMWWATFCVQCITLSQLLNRFRWSPFASPTKMSRSAVFSIVVGMYLVFAICIQLFSVDRRCRPVYAPGLMYYECSITTFGVLLSIVYTILGIAILVMLVRTRMEFRKHYKITGNCCADFCTMWCCSCCSIIQMLRQTHNEDEHKYSCCDCMTGLQVTAPEIV